MITTQYYEVRYGDLVNADLDGDGSIGLPSLCCQHRHRTLKAAQKCYCHFIYDGGSRPYHLGVYSHLPDGSIVSMPNDDETE